MRDRARMWWLVGLVLPLGCSGSSSEPDTESRGDTPVAEPSATDAPTAPNDGPTGPSSSAPATSPSSEPGACDSPNPGVAPLRRLTNAEYRNTLIDLVGEPELIAGLTQNFPREPTSLGFRTSAQALTVTPLVADEYVKTAQALGPVVIAKDGLLPCDVADITPACVQDFVEQFGKRVYRRPLTRGELVRYSNLYDTIVAELGSVQTALEWIATSMLSSSHFLFRVELSEAPGGGVGRPSSYEMATRLSYLLWQTMPDEELFGAAEAGELETEEGIEAQVLRMMNDPKALRVYEFFEQWLDLDEMPALTRSESSYPDFDDRLPELLRAENRAFIYHLLTTRGTFADLLTSETTFANRDLARHYELPQLPAGTTFEEVAAPGRAGVLTQATLLMHDNPTRTSIVKRGLKIRTDFLCQLVPAPPDDVDLSLPELDGALTQRERLEQHRADPTCSTCHSLIDPLGEIFEGFDALGRSRTRDEGGAPVVSGGAVTHTRTLDGEYANPRELALAMAQSDEVRECFTRQAFRFFYGRDATTADRCAQQQLFDAFARNDYRIVDLLFGLTRSDQFLYRAPVADRATSNEESQP